MPTGAIQTRGFWNYRQSVRKMGNFNRVWGEGGKGGGAVPLTPPLDMT